MELRGPSARLTRSFQKHTKSSQQTIARWAFWTYQPTLARRWAAVAICIGKPRTERASRMHRMRARVRPVCSTIQRFADWPRCAVVVPTNSNASGLNNSAPGNQHPQSLAGEGIGWIVLHDQIDPIVSQQLREVIQADLGEGVSISGATVWRLESEGR